MLKKVFGPERVEVTEEWRRLHKEELCDLYSLKTYLGDQIMKNYMGGVCRTQRKEVHIGF